MTRSTLVGLDERMLVESPTLRSHYLDRTDVLDKVGLLAVLPDGIHATTEQVARFYDVPVDTVKSLVKDHRSELESNGLNTIREGELQAFKDRFREDLSSKVLRSARLTVWPRTAVLNLGQLLTGSETAKEVRRYLLAVEATATVEHRVEAYRLIRWQERADYKKVLHCLKLGGAVSEDYRRTQNALYMGLFGQTSTHIKATRIQVDGERKRDGSFTAASRDVAKNYLTEPELKLLDNTVVMVNAQLEIRYPNGAMSGDILQVVDATAGMMRPFAIGARS
jgi:hypothetical protein